MIGLGLLQGRVAMIMNVSSSTNKYSKTSKKNYFIFSKKYAYST